MGDVEPSVQGGREGIETFGEPGTATGPGDNNDVPSPDSSSAYRDPMEESDA